MFTKKPARSLGTLLTAVLLFGGVAQVQTGETDEAAVTLRRAATLAESLGAVPLVWPARAVLGALVAGSSPTEGAASLQAARVAVRQIADDLPGRYSEAWLRRADIPAAQKKTRVKELLEAYGFAKPHFG